MTDKPVDDSKRTIVLIYGMLQSGGPFWTFVAVKPSKYQAFMTAHKEGKVDLYDFKSYGEIIVSGEGKSPPDEITLKVAELYQTDPAELAETIKQHEQEEKP